MSFSKLSPLFRESLREVIDQIKAGKAEKKSSCAGPCGCGGNPVEGKKTEVDDVMSLILEVDQRLIVDWLYALDDGSREEVKRLFTEMRDLSAAEFVLLMKKSGACCPWQFIGSMFKTEDESAQAQNTEIVIVEDSAQDGTAI